VGAGRDDGAIAAASLPGRDVRVVAVVSEPAEAERLLATAAAAGLTGTVDVVTARPDRLPLDDLALRALKILTGNAFVRVSGAGDIAAILPRAARLMQSGRLAAFIWPWRPGSQADDIALRGLAAFGYSHFRVRDGDDGPEMFAFDPEMGGGLVFTLSMDYLAAALSAQDEEPPVQTAHTAAPSPALMGGEPLRVAFDWQLSTSTGWGVYGLNLALHSLRTGRALPIPLTEPSLDGLDPLQRRLLDRVVAPSARRRGAGEAQLVLRALGNGMVGAEGSYEGKPEVGVVFFEDTALDAAAVARARRFERIVAGSTWNGEVLRGLGLDNVEVSLQGIDPTVFHPAPRSGWLGDRFVVFSGGKLEYRKGQDIVVAAFREFHLRHPDSLLMVAWHNHWPQTMAEIPMRGLVRGVPRVDAHGRLDVSDWLVRNGLPADSFVDLGLAPNSQMGRIVREADVALFPNRCEGGTNLVAMECMASGVPTILSANTGHLDLVRESDCYGLYQQGLAVGTRQFRGVEGWGESSVEEIVSVLEKVYTDREEAGRRAAAGAERMQGFAWSHRIDELLGCLADLLSVTSI
jgi:glycosyltransferase involved in cell wall biosynthesis